MYGPYISFIDFALYQSCKSIYFDLLHKTSLSVPMYADRLVLFAFASLLTTVRAVKTAIDN